MPPTDDVRTASTDAVVDAFAQHLAVARGMSPHTVRAYRGDLQHVLAFARRRGVAWQDVDLALLRAWLAAMVSGGLARATIARRGAAVRAFFAWAAGEGLIPADPAVRLVTAQPGDQLPTALALAPAARLVDVSRATAEATGEPGALRDWVVLELLYATGVRVGELVGADVHDVDRSGRLLRVMGKGAKERVVPFGVPAARALDAWLDRGRPALVVPTTGPALLLGTRGGRMDQRQVRTLVHRAALAAGVDDVSPHALRHTAATHLVQGGSDLRSVQEILGHATLATTQRYTHVSPDRLRSSYLQAHPRA
ncbi:MULTISPECIES: tyrosine recombinase XerC [unclassified Actinotalea]|uniref:tyrosine recombinase XerC n=1 Tax=unclassified Actinotalea TaxID=2638618 RepID=UPI0015F6FD76|nr:MULTISPECIES: tyrosine recombinase XerC [unclassified Actinotalea]